MSFSVEYYEYECGFPCTPDGCLGHETDIPVGFELDGAFFNVSGYDGGDFPSSDRAEIDRVKAAMARIERLVRAEQPTTGQESPLSKA